MEPQRDQDDREEKQEPCNEENPVRPIDVDERSDDDAVSRKLKNELREAVERLRSEFQNQLQFEALTTTHVYNQQVEGVRAIEEKAKSFLDFIDLDMQSRGQRELELDRREAILIRRKEKCERIIRRQENLNLREEDVIRRVGDLIRREGDLTRREGDLTRREGDLTRREEDVIRREGDLTQREQDLLRNERVLIQNERALLRKEQEVRRTYSKLAKEEIG